MKHLLKRLCIVLSGVTIFVSLVIPVAHAGSLLNEMQVADTCGMTYADKLASCTPFHCTQPSLMAMMFGFPSEDEIRKMPMEKQKKMRTSMAAAEKKMAAMSVQERAAMKAKMITVQEIKGYDSQGRCHTQTIVSPTHRQDCIYDASMLKRVSDFQKITAGADHVESENSAGMVDGKWVSKTITRVDGKVIDNPMVETLHNGSCKTLEKDIDRGWVSLDQVNRMAHIELTLSEHGKHVAGHVQVLNTTDGKVVFDKAVATDKATRKINLEPGTYDIQISSRNSQLAPVWERGIKLGKGHFLKKDIEFYAITGTLELTVNVNGQATNMSVYMNDPETHQWLYLKAPIFGKEPSFYGKSSRIKLPETLSGKYEVFVTPVTHGFKPPAKATYKKFLLTIRNGDAVAKTVGFSMDKSLTTSNAGHPTNAGSASSCFDRVQGKISWGASATATHWSPANIKRLCHGAEQSIAPANCFDRVMHHGVSHGDGAKWSWNQAIDLCQGTTDANKTITCFEQAIQKYQSLKQAIQQCGK